MDKEILINPEEIADTRKRLIELEKTVQSHHEMFSKELKALEERIKRLEAQPGIVVEVDKK